MSNEFRGKFRRLRYNGPSDSEVSECVTLSDGILSVRVEGGKQLLKMAMDNGNLVETKTDEPSKVEPRVQVESPRHAEEKPEDKFRKACPFTECRIWHGLPGILLEVVCVQVKRLLDWEALALITQDVGLGSINGNTVREQAVQTNEHAQTRNSLRMNDSEGHCTAQ